jgi:hypothetical protein
MIWKNNINNKIKNDHDFFNLACLLSLAASSFSFLTISSLFSPKNAIGFPAYHFEPGIYVIVY